MVRGQKIVQEKGASQEVVHINLESWEESAGRRSVDIPCLWVLGSDHGGYGGYENR